MRYYLLVFMMIASNTFAQINFSFESGDLSDWEMNEDARWDITTDNPLAGMKSLKHVYDTTKAGHDQISIRFDELRLDLDTTTWSFAVQYEYNPSGSNHWSAFLLADNQAADMHPDGTINAYIFGVNFTGSDDLIKVWKLNDGDVEILYNTGYDWENQIGKDTVANFLINRFADGTWHVELEKNAIKIPLGTFYDTTFLSGNYFGLYYNYTSSGDQLLTIDDISIDGTFIADTVPPAIEELVVIDTSSVKLVLNEPVITDSLYQPENFLIATKGIPDSLHVSGSQEVTLKFNTRFTNEVKYLVQVFDMVDQNGNISEQLTDTFFYYQARPNDILITEIHADPLPVMDLPEYEYIEIFNKTQYPIDLTGWTIHTSRVVRPLNSAVLDPGKRLILCHEDAFYLLELYGNCMDAFTSLSTLLNTRDTIFIRDQYNQVIDSMHYSDEWHDDGKNDGGWSLELTNYDRKCREKANWKSSVNPSGGTPGQLNSVHTDQQDMAGPKIQKISKEHDTLYTIEFNEPIDTTSLNILVRQNDYLPSWNSAKNNTLINLYLQANLNEGEFTISTQNIADHCFNTTIHDSITLFHHIPKKHEIVINEFMFDPLPSIDLPEYEFIELLNTSEHTINLKHWVINSESGNYSMPDFELYPDSMAIICHAGAAEHYSSFGSVLPVIGNMYFLPNSGGNVTLASPNNDIIDSITYVPEYYNMDLSGVSLERMKNNLSCMHPRFFSPSKSISGGTPGNLNSKLTMDSVTALPEMQHASFISDSAVLITFSDYIDTASFNDSHITGNHEIGSYTFPDLHTLEMNLQQPVNSGDTLRIQISGITDLCSRLMPDMNLQLVSYKPVKYDLLITEIMFDPHPVANLPEFEYVELVNNSDYDIDLTGFSIRTSNSEKFFTSFVLRPGDRLILCHEDAYEQFNQYGQTMGLFTSQSTLLNTKDTIILFNPDGTAIDSVYYKEDWHQPEKRDGGWSLELTNFARQCTNSYNWKSSVNDLGGTPGQPNSEHVNQIDTIQPWITNSSRLGDTTFLFEFNEPILLPNLSYTCHQHSLLASHTEEVNDTLVKIHVPDELSEGEILFTFREITDLCYNKNTIDSVTFFHHITEAHDIIINEIMPDPSPEIGLPKYEFIELYNNSHHDIHLHGWNISAESGSYALPDVTILANGYVILCHKNALDDYEMYGDALPTIGTTYFLPNDFGSVMLSSSNGKTVDSLYYNTSRYTDILDGKSLERSHSNLACFHPQYLAPSKNKSGGTPGKPNSRFENTSVPPLPNIVSATMSNDTTIKISFDNLLDTTQFRNSVITANYNLSGFVPEDVQAIRIYLSHPIPSGDTLDLQINGLYDLCGNILDEINITFTTYYPGEFDLLITEIMADPEPVVELPNAEYLEIFNATAHNIDVQNIRLLINDKEISVPEGILKAGKYSVFIDHDDHTKFTGFDNLYLLSSLNLLNDENKIVLENSTGEIIHFAYYSTTNFISELKQTGGWSLEMANTENPCLLNHGWYESNSYKGGTPGSPNSVVENSDILYSEIINNIGIHSDSIVRVYLNEYLPHEYISHINPEITPKINVDTARFNLASFSLDVHLNQALAPVKLYGFQLQNIVDCSGNIFDSEHYTIGLPSLPQQRDVLFSEIMFDPMEGQPEFIEIYNDSKTIIDISDLYLQVGSVNEPEQICTESYLLLPGSYAVLTNDVVGCQFSYSAKHLIETQSFSSLNNSEEYIKISSKDGTSIDEFIYQSNLHHEALNETKGVSLERISFEIPTENTSNWQSATAMVGHQTAGAENSQYISHPDGPLDKELVIEPEVFSPDNDGYKDILKIQYQLPEDEYTVNTSIYDASGRLITHITRNEIISNSGTMVWNGMDAEQKIAPMGMYIIYFEAVGSSGKVIQKKETCVLAKSP